MCERINQCVGRLPFGSFGNVPTSTSSSKLVCSGLSAAGSPSRPPANSSLGIYIHVHINVILAHPQSHTVCMARWYETHHTWASYGYGIAVSSMCTHTHTRTCLILWKMANNLNALSMWVTSAANDNICSSSKHMYGWMCQLQSHVQFVWYANRLRGADDLDFPVFLEAWGYRTPHHIPQVQTCGEHAHLPRPDTYGSR